MFLARRWRRGFRREGESIGRSRDGSDGGVRGGRKKGARREDVAQLVRPIHVPMKRLRRTDIVKREENYYDYYY